MNFKNQIETAIRLHEKQTGEKVTTTCIAAILWRKSNPKTQRVRMSQSKKNGINLNSDQITALYKCFPKIPISFWLGNTELIEAIEMMRSRYTIDEITAKPELNIMYIMLNSGYYPKALVEKYLNKKK